ncbi:hypothetical protein AURDEDRAFT_161573 [Auricularia subglabra TFB-10046 SS5]|nr:hypothetical protein AURDEDRAFT_161573 [Auricularia subglabra TFB-10046 SS5]
MTLASTLPLLVIAALAAPVTGSGSRGAQAGFVVGMIVLGIVLALLAFWVVVASCFAGVLSSSRPRGLFGRVRGAGVPALGTAQPPIAITTDTHYGFGTPHHAQQGA